MKKRTRRELSDILSSQNKVLDAFIPSPAAPWQNQAIPLDVNDSGTVTIADVGTLADWLESGGTNPIPPLAGYVQGHAPGNDMARTSENEYDGGESGGDGNLTKSTTFVDDDANHDRATHFGYDFRNRRVWTQGEVDFYAETHYNNFDQAIVRCQAGAR